MRKFFAVAMGSVVALVGFAGAANASATVDLVWIDVTNLDTAGNVICLKPAKRDCLRLGSTISSVAVTDNITLGVIITAGAGGLLGAGVDVDYNDALPKLSVSGFRNLTTAPYLPTTVVEANNDTNGWVQVINAVSIPIIDPPVGIGLPAGATAYLGTVTFHKDFLVNGQFEIAVGVDGPDGVSDVLSLDGSKISDSTTFNSAFLVNLPDDHCEIDKKCSVGGSEPQDSCTADPGEEVTYTYDFIEGCGLVIDDKLGVIGEWKGQTLSRTTTLTETTTNRAFFDLTECICLSSNVSDSVTVTVGTLTPTPTSTPTPSADCLCQVTNISPDTINLNKVGSGGKQANRLRKIIMQVKTVDAPGATCDRGESSGPQAINLLMVDDDADETQGILIDSAKTLVCDGPTKLVTRTVLVQGPLNCKDSAVPDGTSSGVITATGSAPGTADFVKDMKINCNE